MMEPNIEVFGKSVRAFREQARMTKAELAKKVGLTSTSISSYEKGAKKPTLESALSIAAAFGTTVDEMCKKEVCLDIFSKSLDMSISKQDKELRVEMV